MSKHEFQIGTVLRNKLGNTFLVTNIKCFQSIVGWSGEVTVQNLDSKVSTTIGLETVQQALVDGNIIDEEKEDVWHPVIVRMVGPSSKFPECHDECPHSGKCGNHYTAKIYRIDNGMTPTLKLLNGAWVCDKTKTNSHFGATIQT